MRKTCSTDRENLRSLEQFVRTVKGQNKFWQQNAFLTCSWRFLISNNLEQLDFKLEKNNCDVETYRNKLESFIADSIIFKRKYVVRKIETVKGQKYFKLFQNLVQGFFSCQSLPQKSTLNRYMFLFSLFSFSNFHNIFLQTVFFFFF